MEEAAGAGRPPHAAHRAQVRRVDELPQQQRVALAQLREAGAQGGLDGPAEGLFEHQKKLALGASGGTDAVSVERAP